MTGSLKFFCSFSFTLTPSKRSFFSKWVLFPKMLYVQHFWHAFFPFTDTQPLLHARNAVHTGSEFNLFVFVAQL